jgi:hypothetical protein
MKKALLFIATAALSSVSLPVLAAGVFDALDPCIQQRDKFHDERVSYLQQLDKSVADADNAPLTQEYRAAWMVAKRAQLRPTFDTLVAPTLQDAGIADMEGAYGRWFEKQLATIGAANMDNLVRARFHQELKQVRVGQRTSGQAQLEAAKLDLDKACKTDVGNQVLRGVITVALTPIEMASKNLEIAKRESGAIAKGIAATTGISIDAINKNGGVFGGGLSGGENSFFRKNLGIRF